MQRLHVVLIAEGEIPWILNKVLLKFNIVFLSEKSCRRIEHIKETGELYGIFCRVVAAGESQTAATEAQYRRGSEVCGHFFRSPELHFVPDGLSIGTVFQPLYHTLDTGALNEFDVDCGVVWV